MNDFYGSLADEQKLPSTRSARSGSAQPNRMAGGNTSADITPALSK
jgi:hypothetical protein